MIARYRTAVDYWRDQATQESGGGLWSLAEAVGDALDLSGNGSDGTVTAAEGQRAVEPSLYDRGLAGMRFEEGTTNLVTNPVAGVDTTGYISGGTSNLHERVVIADEGLPALPDNLSTITTALKLTLDGVTDKAQLVSWAPSFSSMDFGAAGRKALSAYVLIPEDWDGGAPAISVFNAAGSTSVETSPASLALRGQWQRIHHIRDIDAGDTTGAFAIRNTGGSGTNGRSIYVTVLQAEAKPRPTSECVGSMGTGYSWASTAHASASTRVATSVNLGSGDDLDNIFDGGGAAGVVFNMTGRPAESAFSRLLDKNQWVLYVDGDNRAIYFNRTFSGGLAQWRSQLGAVTFGVNYALVVGYDDTDAGNDPAMYLANLDTGAITQLTITEVAAPSGTASTDASSTLYVGNSANGNRTWYGLIALPRVWQGTQPTAGQIARFFRLALEAEEIELGPARVLLYDGSFRRLGQLTTATSINRSYRMESHGQASITIAVDDPLIGETSSLEGRIVVIESTVYPVPWVGKLTGRRGDRASGTVTLEADSFDAILDERALPRGYSTSGSAGGELARIISTVNSRNPTGIEIGAIQNHVIGIAGLSFPEWTARRALNAIAEQGGLEWWLDYMATATNIEILFRAARNRGFNRYRSVTLHDGGNCTWTDWREDGKAYTFALTVVAGQTSVTESYTERARSTRIVQEGGGFVTQYEQVPFAEPIAPAPSTQSGNSGSQSISIEGFVHGFITIAKRVLTPVTTREVVEVREELKTRDVTVQSAQARLNNRRLSEKVISITHLDPTEWDTLEVGSVVRLVAPGAFVDGFDGPARILGVQPMEELGECDVVLELLEDPEAA